MPVKSFKRVEPSRTSSTSDKRLSESSKVDDGISAIGVFLQNAQGVGALSAIPFLGDAIGVALTLVQTIQATRENQSAFQQLACDASRFTTEVVKTALDLKYDNSNLPPRFTEAVKKLLEALRRIESYSGKQVKRGFAKRYFLNIADRTKVTDCERAFQSAVNTFQTVGIMSTWAGMETLRAEQRVPTRAATLPVQSMHNFTVTDGSRGHTFITGPGGVINQSTGLRVIMPANRKLIGDRSWTDSPISETPTLPWANTGVIDHSEGHIYDTSRGGGINLQQGASLAYY